jgi:hypothetical protein
MKQLPLLPEGLVLFINMRRRHLECHILIRHLRDIGKEENTRKTEDEDTDSEVNPLHTLQGSNVIGCLREKRIRA